ncbi:hypothetical protein BDY19DRAFT_998361 [Irpex rosettiformis]|uniref:Uncharacterized protein n=1 Tax=Irpex rosettiformis TaxID=378272 RepID=A0ACB8TNV3_9APHY|nr:hypothetical protein BDY19DRAFT_998361 [Irpex rosettiformis]
MLQALRRAHASQVYVSIPPLPDHLRRLRYSNSVVDDAYSVPGTVTRPQLDRRCDGVVDAILSCDIEDHLSSIQDLLPAVTSSDFLRQTLLKFDELDAGLARSSVPGCLDKDTLALCAMSTRGIKEYCAGTDRWLALYCQRIMLTDTILDRSLRHIVDTVCPDVVLAVMDGTLLDCDDWLLNLIKKVTTLVKCGLPVAAKSTQFFPATELAPKQFTEDASVALQCKHLPSCKVKPLVLSYLRRILFMWFGSETPFTAQLQGALVRALVTHLGPGSLLLPDVWALYCAPPSWILSRECPRPDHANTSSDAVLKSEYLEPFLTRLTSDPRIHAARVSMQRLQDGYILLHERTHTHVQGTIERATKAGNLRRLIKSMSAIAFAEERPVDLTLNTNSPSSVANLPTARDTGSSATAASSTIDRVPIIPTLSAARRVIRFLQDSLVVVHAIGGASPEVSHLTDAQKLIMRRPDFYLPLREMAPSRVIMNAGLGRAFASTRAGFFSLQVFRHIHFNTEAFKLCPQDLRQVEFHSLSEYKQYVTALKARFPGRDDSFFCDKKALGSPINNRTIERADDYWDVAMSPDYAWPPPRQFAAARKDMLFFKNSLQPEDKHMWSGVGSLSMFLLLLDMHFAGLVDEPTVEDVADIVASLQKGATYGLQKLGYLNASFTQVESRAQFQRFYQDMTCELTEEQVTQFGWNPVVCEHTLCKYSRLFGEGFYH